MNVQQANNNRPTINDQDDVDDEITAVFAEGETEDGMSKSWHGSRSARYRGDGNQDVFLIRKFSISVKRALVSLLTSVGLRVQENHRL